MAAKKPTAVVEKMYSLFDGGLTPLKAQRALNQQGIPCGHASAHHHYRAWRLDRAKWRLADHPPAQRDTRVSKPEPENPVVPETREVERKVEGDTARVEWVTAEHVQTEDDLIRVCKIDTTRWRVKKMTVKAYQTGMKLTTREITTGGGKKISQETPTVVQLFSVAAELELILPKPYLDGTEALFERLAAGAPVHPDSPRDVGPYIATMGLFDVHFAKLCWGKETGRGDYDLWTADTVYRNAGLDLLDKLKPYPVSRFLLPLGQDLFHVDSAKNTTTGGTVVDCDSRYPKMIEIGSAAVIWLIDLLQTVAPVDVFYVPGNHDRQSSYHLCREIRSHFRLSPGVAVEIDPNIRKYRRYGQCLFGYRHGDLLTEAQIPTLPGMMADEAREDWGQTTCHAWFLGHRHTSRRYVSKESDEIRGTRMHYLPALSGTDAWHHEYGFIGNAQAAEVYIHSPDIGYVGRFVAPART